MVEFISSLRSSRVSTDEASLRSSFVLNDAESAFISPSLTEVAENAIRSLGVHLPYMMRVMSLSRSNTPLRLSDSCPQSTELLLNSSTASSLRLI